MANGGLGIGVWHYICPLPSWLLFLSLSQNWAFSIIMKNEDVYEAMDRSDSIQNPVCLSYCTRYGKVERHTVVTIYLVRFWLTFMHSSPLSYRFQHIHTLSAKAKRTNAVWFFNRSYEILINIKIHIRIHTYQETSWLLDE